MHNVITWACIHDVVGVGTHPHSHTSGTAEVFQPGCYERGCTGHLCMAGRVGQAVVYASKWPHSADAVDGGRAWHGYLVKHGTAVCVSTGATHIPELYKDLFLLHVVAVHNLQAAPTQ